MIVRRRGGENGRGMSLSGILSDESVEVSTVNGGLQEKIYDIISEKL